MSRICYFGAFDPHYPRNQILRHGLALQGMEVVAVNAPRRWPTARKLPFLAKAFLSSQEARGCRAVVLAEFGQSLAGLAWALALNTSSGSWVSSKPTRPGLALVPCPQSWAASSVNG